MLDYQVTELAGCHCIDFCSFASVLLLFRNICAPHGIANEYCQKVDESFVGDNSTAWKAAQDA